MIMVTLSVPMPLLCPPLFQCMPRLSLPHLLQYLIIQRHIFFLTKLLLLFLLLGHSLHPLLQRPTGQGIVSLLQSSSHIIFQYRINLLRILQFLMRFIQCFKSLSRILSRIPIRMNKYGQPSVSSRHLTRCHMPHRPSQGIHIWILQPQHSKIILVLVCLENSLHRLLGTHASHIHARIGSSYRCILLQCLLLLLPSYSRFLFSRTERLLGILPVKRRRRILPLAVVVVVVLSSIHTCWR
mmetsp:Transcript_3823/g.7779  ORF Transcript_3823/g.7779 Transcript_3823/m.7779 type:complete len:240 (-) Transcript_3823:22-741(-)